MSITTPPTNDEPTRYIYAVHDGYRKIPRVYRAKVRVTAKQVQIIAAVNTAAWDHRTRVSLHQVHWTPEEAIDAWRAGIRRKIDAWRARAHELERLYDMHVLPVQESEKT